MALKIAWIQLKIRETETVINNPVDLDQTPFECLRNYAPNPDKFRYSEPYTSRNNLIINQLKIDIISDLINRPDANNNNDNGEDQLLLDGIPILEEIVNNNPIKSMSPRTTNIPWKRKISNLKKLLSYCFLCNKMNNSYLKSWEIISSADQVIT